jgi:hypothetical protein
VIDVASSVVGGSNGGSSIQGQLRADGSFDVMFNSRGIVEGGIASQGQIHFVVVDGDDIERGYRLLKPGGTGYAGPFVDVDGTPGWDDVDGDGPDERQGDVFIISVRTQTGSIYVSDLNPAFDSTTGFYTDPFVYAEAGGEAR